MEEHGTHLSKHEAKGGLRSALRILLVCFIVIAINLQLTYFDRAPYGAWSARYILKLFGDVSFVPLVEAYFLYHLVERLGEEVERWPIIPPIAASMVRLSHWASPSRCQLVGSV